MTERRIVFIQHGDYAEAVVRFASGGDETYASQRYSVDFVAELAKSATVTVVCLPAPKGTRKLENGVTSIGLGWKGRRRYGQLLALLERLSPTDLVLRTPLPAVLAWALARGVRVLPIIADSFGEGSGGRWSLRVFVALCNTKGVEIVSNHNRAASQGLVDLGVSATKVIPWDWPQLRRPDDLPPKEHPNREDWTIFYAGTLSEDKGVSDLIRAIGLLRRRKITARLVLAGAGNQEAMQAVIDREDLSQQVEFLGRIANTRVFALMRESDIIVVPSRHSYPEGLPIVITEALCSRTPLLLSDHPVFQATFGRDSGMRYFTAGSPDNLADHLEQTMSSEGVYRDLSINAQKAWEASQVGLNWGELVSRWLAGTPEDLASLRLQTLDASVNQFRGALDEPSRLSS